MTRKADLGHRTAAALAALLLAGTAHGQTVPEAPPPPSPPPSDEVLTTPLGDVAEPGFLKERRPIAELGRPRSYYLAGSEALGPNEMRVIALGTGMPQVQKDQASSCFYVELGNGDSFLFDLGTGCTANMSKLEQPWDRFSKVFISHLHADHFGDMGALVAGGWQMGRSVPIEVWGPSGTTPELGTKAAMTHLMGMLRWEYVSKRGRAPMSSYALKVHEFDYSKVQTVYDRGGVVIKAWPAVHTMDGAVSYSLEWNGLKFAYSGDTTANNWFLDNARESDMVIHECSDPVEVLIHSRHHPAESAWLISTTSHTQPELAGQVFTRLAPRMAVCFHYVNNGLDATQKLYAAVRRTYAGPFSIAEDMKVWNVTPDRITERFVVGGNYTFSLPRAAEAPDVGALVEPSPWLEKGRMDASDAYREVLKNLDPESRKRILERVPKDKLPK
ncbi:MAG: guanitoxin biosynthesis MBL fold metallo-hydrolase GntH [Sphingomonas sp.]